MNEQVRGAEDTKGKLQIDHDKGSVKTNKAVRLDNMPCLFEFLDRAPEPPGLSTVCASLLCCRLPNSQQHRRVATPAAR